MGLVALMAIQEGATTPPPGGISPLAWVIIVALATTLVTVTSALWYRGNKIQDKMYDDLKACQEKRIQTEEDILGLLKVLRLQMEASRGGRKG